MQEGAVYSALSGSLSLHRRLETVANNLANATTTGYKADRLDFTGVLSQAQGEGQAREPGPGVIFPVMEGTRTDHGQGAIKSTGRPLDFAIEGPGFFRVRLEGGETAYTRDGQFQLNSEGRLTDSEGRPVLGPEGQPLDPGSREVSVNKAGDLFVRGQDGPVGRLAVVRAENPAQLEKQGDNLYRAPEDQMVEAEGARVRSGHLEQSNVNTMSEMVRMLDLQRSYQSMTKAMRTIDEAYSQSGERLASPGR